MIVSVDVHDPPYYTICFLSALLNRANQNIVINLMEISIAFFMQGIFGDRFTYFLDMSGSAFKTVQIP